MPSRCCIQYVSKSGRPSSGHKIGKAQFSSQFTRRVVSKNVLTIGQLHSSPMLERSCLKSGFMQTKNFQMSKPGLEKEKESEIKLSTFAGSQNNQGRAFQKNIYLCFHLRHQAFYCVDHNKLCKALKEMRISDHLTCLLRNLYIGQEATVRTLSGTTDWFQIEKGV